MTDRVYCVSDVMSTISVFLTAWFASCPFPASGYPNPSSVRRHLSHSRFRAGRFRARAGFTILELVTVLVVGGVLTSLAMAKVTQIMVSQRLKASMIAVQNDIEGISWDASKLQLNVTDRAGTTTYRRTTLGSAYGLKASNVTFSVSPLEIFPNGLAASSLVIALSANGFVDTVFVSRAGLVRTK